MSHTTADTTPPTTIEIQLVQRAVARAQDVLLGTQLPDGGWRSPDDMGPACVAQVAASLRFLDLLDPADAAEILADLTAQQRADGSFVAYPFAGEGEICATAMALAGYRAVGLGDDDDRVRRARAFIAAHGGEAALIEASKQGDLGALTLALVGLLDPRDLPAPPTFLAAIPAVERFLERRFNVGFVMGMMQTSIIVRFLRGDWGDHGDHPGFVASLERRRCLELLDVFQNEAGDWNGNTPQTALAMAALHAMGLPADDPRIARAVAWIRRRIGRRSEGVSFSAFGSGIWAAALNVRALIESGVRRDHPAIVKAIGWILDGQSRVPQSALSNPGAAHPTGGWAFQQKNHTMPDPDDTGVVLSALGLALDASDPGNAIPADLADRVRVAVERASRWLAGMHNPDGGFSAFEHGLPGQRTRDPIMTHPIAMPEDLAAAARFVLDPPVDLGDPSTADVTARVVHGLCKAGCAPSSPEIKRSLAFLDKRELASGATWGRWMVNYLPATACVIMALAAAGADMKSHRVRRAIRWIIDHQNPDGGFGEDVATYRDPSLAGRGPSMPPLTGLVTTALIDAGHGDSDTVARAVRYLLAEQRADGTWPNGGFLHVFLSPSYRPCSFYYLPLAQRYYPLEALGRYLSFRAGRAAVPRAGVTVASVDRADHLVDLEVPSGVGRKSDGTWDEAYLERMRGVGDHVADEVVKEIFRDHEVKLVNKLVERLLRADDRIPEGLPPAVAAYYERTASLPAWADPEKISTAQQLFVRTGWATAISLFCSSLPQAYCAAQGARVLHATQRIEADVPRRIMETAQFIFDVMEEGALAPAGRGVRAAQKVRLLHATNRFLLMREARWDMAWGVPVNQEDTAFTLMTFSCVVLDALARFDVEVSAEEAEAWLHAWKVVGYLLGLHEALMPRDVADGEALMAVYRRLQWAPSTAGQELAKALVGSMQRFSTPMLVPGMPVTLIRYLAGDHVADILGLPRADWTRLLLEAGAVIEAAVKDGDHRSRRSAMLRQVSHRLMRAFVEVQRPNREVGFRIPAGLRQAWNL